MDENYIAFISYSVGGACFAALTLLLAYLCKQKLVHPFLVFASLCSLLWSAAIAANYQNFTLPREGLLLLETLRYASWIVALMVSLQFATGQRLPRIFRAMLHSLWLISFILIGTLIVLKPPTQRRQSVDMEWSNLSHRRPGGSGTTLPQCATSADDEITQYLHRRFICL
jgi:hypothetical protein